MKKILVIGNWKLNGNKNTITESVVKLTRICDNISKCHIAIAPPVMYLDIVRHHLISNHSRIQLCAQNVDVNIAGSFTGDISAIMLKDLNTKYVIIGHSERRKQHQENNTDIAKKFFILKQNDLIPVLCIGENTQEHKSGNTISICINQIEEIIKLFGIKVLQNSVIAYEPIWAIGSGICAIPKNVQIIHKSIRDYIAYHDQTVANQIIIQYGGSITPKNVTQFLDQKDIDGVLVGTASLDVNSFSMIIQESEKHPKSHYFNKNN